MNDSRPPAILFYCWGFLLWQNYRKRRKGPDIINKRKINGEFRLYEDWSRFKGDLRGGFPLKQSKIPHF
jgi:hypothetical protein